MAPSLGDYFPKEIRDDFSDRKTKLKSVLLIKIPEFFDITYPKYAIIVCLSTCENYFGLVSINTEPNLTGNCIKITAKDYAFLEYNSHVGCDFICPKLISEIKTFITKNPENIIGELSDFHHIQILEKLTNSRVLTGKQKKQFNLI